MTSAPASSAVQATTERCARTEIRAVCLDVDDTLIDHTGSARAALRTLVDRDDLWPLWQQVTDQYALRVVAGEFDYDTMRNRRTGAFLAALGWALTDAEVADLEDRRLVEMRAGWRPFEDALPCLEWLQAIGLKVCAVTNASGPRQLVRLADLGLAPYLDHVVAAAEVGAAKPDPVIFHTACVKLDVHPEETVHVGDRLDLDAVGAVGAGLHGVWLDRDGDAGEDPPPGVWTISCLAELPELLVGDLAVAAANTVPR